MTTEPSPYCSLYITRKQTEELLDLLRNQSQKKYRPLERAALKSLLRNANGKEYADEKPVTRIDVRWMAGQANKIARQADLLRSTLEKVVGMLAAGRIAQAGVAIEAVLRADDERAGIARVARKQEAAS